MESTTVELVVEELLARHRAVGWLGLDDVADAVGLRAVGYEEVDAILERLHEAGVFVGEPDDAPPLARLGRVLEAARVLRERLGRAPRAEEIAGELGEPVGAVRDALKAGALFARPGR